MSTSSSSLLLTVRPWVWSLVNKLFLSLPMLNFPPPNWGRYGNWPMRMIRASFYLINLMWLSSSLPWPRVVTPSPWLISIEVRLHPPRILFIHLLVASFTHSLYHPPFSFIEAPLPKLEGIFVEPYRPELAPPPPTQKPALAITAPPPPSMTPSSSASSSNSMSIPPNDKAKYARLFASCSPVNGELDGKFLSCRKRQEIA